MAYIQIELMAIEHADFVAQTLGCRKVEILGGLVELWQFSWKRCEDIHQISALQAWFAFEPSKTLSALEAFGFAEDLKNGTFRVKGAERYLRIRQQRAAAGKKGGLKRAEKAAKQLASTSQASAKQVPSKSLAIASNDENDPKTKPENEAEIKQVLSKSLASAKQVLSKSLEGAKQLSGNTEHRTQNTEHRLKDINSVADATSDIDSKEKAPAQAKIEESFKTTLKAFQSVYNEKVGDTLPQWSKDSQKRNAAVKTWLKSRTLEDWSSLLEKVKTRPFLMGQNDRGWKADALFLLKTENAIKIEEGGYSGKAGVNQQLTTSKPRPKSTAEMLEDSLKNAPTFKPLKERNPELWAKNEKWKAHQEEVERQREEKRREYEKLQLEKLRNYEQEKLANGDLEWEDAFAQGEK